MLHLNHLVDIVTLQLSVENVQISLHKYYDESNTRMTQDSITSFAMVLSHLAQSPMFLWAAPKFALTLKVPDTAIDALWHFETG